MVKEPSINARTNVFTVTNLEPCWMSPIMDFFAKDRLLVNGKEADKVRCMVAQYWLSVDHELYRRSFGGPYLRCLPSSKVGELLTELHEGVCGSHVGGCTLAHGAMNQGFWWP